MSDLRVPASALPPSTDCSNAELVAVLFRLVDTVNRQALAIEILEGRLSELSHTVRNPAGRVVAPVSPMRVANRSPPVGWQGPPSIHRPTTNTSPPRMIHSIAAAFPTEPSRTPPTTWRASRAASPRQTHSALDGAGASPALSYLGPARSTDRRLPLAPTVSPGRDRPYRVNDDRFTSPVRDRSWK